MVNPYDQAPWQSIWGFRPGFHDPTAYQNALQMFLSNVQKTPEYPCISYFDRTWTARQVDEETDALAVGLAELGVSKGDRVGLYIQNMPEFITTTLAAWKLGAVIVPINPMYQDRELRHIVSDSGMKVILALEELLPRVHVIQEQSELEVVIATNGLRALDDPEHVPAPLRQVEPSSDFTAFSYESLIDYHRGTQPVSAQVRGDDIAFLAYTSGTTGPAKGAMLSHESVVFSAQTFKSMRDMTSEDVIYAMAPLFHVTGMICTLALGLLVPCRMVLGYRFHITTAMELIERYRATFTVGATTVFNAFLETNGFDQRDISSLKKIICGGAPIPPSVVQRYEAATGVYLHNGYGLTETTAPTFGTPPGQRSPVSPTSGALALGIPIPDTQCRLLGHDDTIVDVGEPGEIVVRGTHVMAGYWNNPEETQKATLEGGWVRTGDIAVMDEQGWFYLVDRKKDQINASGFKVWPQEVEEALYEHPAVREAAVVGVPDSYRGETVKAYVSLRQGETVEPDELVAFCRTRLAAFKVPRLVEILDELPKNVAGKILRRELFKRNIAASAAISTRGFGGSSMSH